MRAMHQQFTATLEELARLNTELQNEQNQSRQQGAKELAALRQEVRGAPLRVRQATGVGVGLRGAGRVARLEHSVQGETLTDNAAKATGPTPNATIMDDDDRAASAHLYWMMLMTCKGRSAQHSVLGRRQRRSRSLATTD